MLNPKCIPTNIKNIKKICYQRKKMIIIQQLNSKAQNIGSNRIKNSK